VGVDYRCDRRVGLGPLEIERIAGWSMTEDDRRIGGEERSNEKQGEQAHVGFGQVTSATPSGKPAGFLI
jgi:hypothetical protein